MIYGDIAYVLTENVYMIHAIASRLKTEPTRYVDYCKQKLKRIWIFPPTLDSHARTDKWREFVRFMWRARA